MSFRVTARTILHLGSDLNSSNGVAFSEFIKNSLDAGSTEVRVNVIQRINFDHYDHILREFGERRDVADWMNASTIQETENCKDLRPLH